MLAEVELIGGAAELDLCTLDPTDAQADVVFQSLATGSYALALEAVTATLALEIGEGYGTMLTCDRFDDSFTNGIGLNAIAAPSDLQAFAEFFANPDGIDVTVTPSGSGSGGDFFEVCAIDTEEPDFSYCEIDWIADGLMLTAWVAGSAAAEVDLAPIQAAFETRIPFILTNLARAGG